MRAMHRQNAARMLGRWKVWSACHQAPKLAAKQGNKLGFRKFGQAQSVPRPVECKNAIIVLRSGVDQYIDLIALSGIVCRKSCSEDAETPIKALAARTAVRVDDRLLSNMAATYGVPYQVRTAKVGKAFGNSCLRQLSKGIGQLDLTRRYRIQKFGQLVQSLGMGRPACHRSDDLSPDRKVGADDPILVEPEVASASQFGGHEAETGEEQ